MRRRDSICLMICMVIATLCGCIDLRERTSGDADVEDILQDQDLEEDLGPLEDMPLEDMAERDASPVTMPQDECNGRDDDQDGNIDETSFDVPRIIHIQFSELTGVGDDGYIEITDGAGVPIAGSPFLGADLAGRVVSIMGNRFSIRLFVDEGGDRTRGYEITQITDQDGRVITEPYPDPPRSMDGFIDPSVDDVQTWITGDSQGGGIPCGDYDDTGVCQRGVLTCQLGALLCLDEISPVAEVACDCLDNDCDGKIDEVIEGEGASPSCTLDELHESAAGRHCILRGEHQVLSGDYTFDRLTIAPDAALNVIPSADPSCGGHVGHTDIPGEACLLGGGCLTLKANHIDVSGSIRVDAESTPMNMANCGGGSGGDLVIISDHLRVDQGTLSANGSAGNSPNFNSGGGAAGHIKIYAEEIELINGLIEARGGDANIITPEGGNNNEVVGAGPGGVGGAGAIAGARGGGAGSGGRGLGASGGIEDPTRALEIVGHITRDTSSSVQPYNGRGEPDGYLIFGGQATSLINLETISPAYHPSSTTLYPLVIRLTDREGRALPQISVNLSLMKDSQDHYGYDLGLTDEHGWLKVDRFASLPQADYRYRVSIDATGGGTLFISYASGDVTCSQRYPLDERGEVVIANFAECAEARFDCGDDCEESTPTIKTERLPCAEDEISCPMIQWVLIEGGDFMIGSSIDRGESRRDERPQQLRTLQSFEMMLTEVTVRQYRACVNAGACSPPECFENTSHLDWLSCNYLFARDDHPINHVRWDQLRDFARWAGGELPTEAQWEFAARSRGQEVIYPWGDAPPSCTRVTGDGEELSCGNPLGTRPVCAFPEGSSAQGLCDLAGNVYEMVLDEYVEGYAEEPVNGSANCRGDSCDDQDPRIARGGHWKSAASDLRAARRGQSRLDESNGGLGGRLVRSLTR